MSVISARKTAMRKVWRAWNFGIHYVILYPPCTEKKPAHSPVKRDAQAFAFNYRILIVPIRGVGFVLPMQALTRLIIPRTPTTREASTPTNPISGIFAMI